MLSVCVCLVCVCVLSVCVLSVLSVLSVFVCLVCVCVCVCVQTYCFCWRLKKRDNSVIFGPFGLSFGRKTALATCVLWLKMTVGVPTTMQLFPEPLALYYLRHSLSKHTRH